LNVLFILADDMGYGDLSSYGSTTIHTPHIDSIGRQGVTFTQFYCNSPECSPTRSALLSGQYQQRFGGLECAIGVGNAGRYEEAAWLQKRDELGLPVSAVTMPRILKDNGYDTAIIGKWHLGYLPKFSPNRHGFDEFYGILGGNADYFTRREEDSDLPCFYHNDKPIEEPGYSTDLFTQHAVSWLKQRSKAPFFLYVPYTAPHLPLQSPDDERAPRDNTSHERYRKMIERMDQGVGELLAQIERMGAAANTLVVFTSDNGAIPAGNNAPFRGFKSSVWEGGIHMPCMARLPGVIRPGSRTAQVGLTMDWLPTILSAAGVKPPAGKNMDGVDLLPVLRGERQPFSRTVFWRFKRAEVRRKAVRSGDWKYVWDKGEEELHNLADDPGEAKDLLKQQPEIAVDLRAKLAAWEVDVRAPRLRDFPGGER
jgi:N-acetylgalactosamine-6-sulfatase